MITQHTFDIGVQPVDDPVAYMEELLAINQHTINLLLGAKPGKVQINNLDRLQLWFEQT